MSNKTVIIRIRRQKSPSEKPYWDEFELPSKRGM